MFRYILAVILLMAALVAPIKADEKNNHNKVMIADSAHVTTFTILVVQVVDGERNRTAIRIMEDGAVACKHVVISVDDDWKKTVNTEVESKLTDEELKTVKELFAKLEIDTLETPKQDEEPEKFVVIQAHDGSKGYRFGNPSLTAFGDKKERVEPFVKAILKIMDRLK